ncbi:MAG: hypothetical protein F7C32_02480 [Desulfurococcales archaeon]|nr:hypothetical protein [Desulfurococcales archaeon]
MPVAIVNCTTNTYGVKVIGYDSLSRLGTLNKNVIVKLLESVSEKTPYKLGKEASYPLVYVSNGRNYMLETELYYQERGRTAGVSYSVYAYYATYGIPALIVLKQRSGGELIEARITLVKSSDPLPGSVDLDKTPGVKLSGPLSAIILIGALFALANISKYRVDKWYGWADHNYTF